MCLKLTHYANAKESREHPDELWQIPVGALWKSETAQLSNNG